MAFLQRSEIPSLAATLPQRSNVESGNQKWLQMETLATLQYSDFNGCLLCHKKLASFPFYPLLSVISGLVLNELNSAYVLETFLICLLISDT